MLLSLSEQKILRTIVELQGNGGVDYSRISDSFPGGGAARILASLEMKGLVHVNGEAVEMTSLGAVMLQTYR